MKHFGRQSPRKGTRLMRGVALLLLSGSVVGAASGPSFRRAYPVGSAPHLHLKNYLGTIEVRSESKDRVVVTADVPESQVKVEPGENQINVAAVKTGGIRPVKFLVTVPRACAVTLQGYNSKVVVRDVSGDIEVETHEGDIELADVQSSFVKANSINGRITFKGEIVPGGKYQMDTINSIDVWVPADASFDLSATSEREHINLGGFNLINPTSGRRITGRYGAGGAKMQLTSQSSIHLHQR